MCSVVCAYVGVITVSPCTVAVLNRTCENCISLIVIVACCVNIAVNVFIISSCAGVSCVTLFRASGISYYCVVVVAECFAFCCITY